MLMRYMAFSYSGKNTILCIEPVFFWDKPLKNPDKPLLIVFFYIKS